MSLHKYRIEAGTGSNSLVGHVDVQDGRIVTAPFGMTLFIGEPLHFLQWWVTARYRTCRIVRLPNLDDPEGERRFWEEGVTALKAANSVCTVSEENPQGPAGDASQGARWTPTDRLGHCEDETPAGSVSRHTNPQGGAE